ncbi:MAG: metal-dependent hydrolase [Bacteroidia bacterium]|nr:metal-dependent hydrolase [Bacteroidia bacterium]
MASVITHSLLGFGLTRVLPRDKRTPLFVLLATIAPSLPDLDSLGFYAGIPYESFFGHRGFFHSFLFSVMIASCITLIIRKYTSFSGFFVLVFFSCIVASHGVLDAMTTGGRGVALLSPFENTRFFLPWRVIQVSPMYISQFFGEWGREVLMSEMKYVWLPLSILIFLRWIAVNSFPALHKYQ